MKLSHLIEAIIILNVTGLFAFLASPAGVKIWVITAVMMALLGVYIVLNFFSIIRMIRTTKILVLQINVVLVWPLLTAFYSNYITIDAVLIVVFPFFQILASAILVYRNGIKVVSRITLISIALTGFGVFANILYPDLFISVGQLADTNVFEQGGRMCGFLMHPNALGMTAVILLIGYLLFQRTTNSIFITYIVFITTIVCILLSGSRSALIACILAAFFYYFILIRDGFKKSSTAPVKNLLFLILTIIISNTLVLTFNEKIDSKMGSSELFDRIELLLSGKISDSDDITQDGSVSIRIEAQSKYWKRLYENPILGFGIGADLAYRQSSEFFLSAHSDALRLAVEYGSFYSIFFFWVLAVVSIEFAKLWHSTAYALIFFAPVGFLYIFAGNFLDLRIIYTLLGMIAGYVAISNTINRAY